MTALLLLLLGFALVAGTGLLVAVRLTTGSVVETLLAAYVIAFAEIVVVVLALSPARWLNPWTLLSTVAGCFALAATASMRTPARRRLHLFSTTPAVFRAGRDPVVVALAIAVGAAAAYAVALAIFTPQNSDDALYYHLTRAALWKQNHGVSYMSGPFDARVNGSPPNAEVAMLFTMLFGGGRYVGLVQLCAYVALMLGTFGLARRVGLGTDQALFGALIVGTLPIVVLQSSAALNDVVTASLLVTAVYFALSASRPAAWLAALAAGLALGTKVPALLALPLVGAAALVPQLPRRTARAAMVVLSALGIGSYWYVVNLIERGSLDGGVGGESRLTPDRSPADTLARLDRLAIDTLDLSGARGRDRFVYAVAATLMAGTAAVLLRRRLRVAAVTILAAALVSVVPLAFPRAREILDRAHFKLWLELGRRDLASIAGHDLTRAGTLSSWYGPLLLVLGLPAIVLVWRQWRARRLPRTAMVFALAPIYGIVVLALAIDFQDLSGRFLMPEVALAASAWGVALRARAVAWAVVAIACSTLLLALVNDAERPAGIRLLAASHGSIWTEPRWRAQTALVEPELGRVLEFFDAHVPPDATVAMATTPSDALYPFFGPKLERRLVFLSKTSALPMQAGWLVIRPGIRVPRCGADWQTTRMPSDWLVLQRVGSRGCVDTDA